MGGREHPLALRVTSGGVSAALSVSGTWHSAEVGVNGAFPVVVEMSERDGEEFIALEGESHRAWYRIDGSTTWVCVGGETWPFVEEDVTARHRGSAMSSDDVRSPMPGTVVRVRTSTEDVVHAGDALVVVSAMKMEHVLVAPRDGTVDILVREGDSVVVDEVVARLVALEELTETGP
jgi:acetyl-CoA/propionyl-CoA carboxylase biotin carboxyl carrier protein